MKCVVFGQLIYKNTSEIMTSVIIYERISDPIKDDCNILFLFSHGRNAYFKNH